MRPIVLSIIKWIICLEAVFSFAFVSHFVNFRLGLAEQQLRWLALVYCLVLVAVPDNLRSQVNEKQ